MVCTFCTSILIPAVISVTMNFHIMATLVLVVLLHVYSHLLFFPLDNSHLAQKHATTSNTARRKSFSKIDNDGMEVILGCSFILKVNIVLDNCGASVNGRMYYSSPIT